MSYASRSGRAKTSATRPQAFAVCQRCGQWYNRASLKFQFDWRGPKIENLYILVCGHCYDKPQEQLRAITLPADPVPIFYPSVEDFANAESDYRAVAFAPATDPRTGLPIPSHDLRTTTECLNRTTIPYGDPIGLDANAVMPLQINNGIPTHYDIVLPVLSVFSYDCLVTVTCSAVHNLQANQQVAVAGMTNGNGFYSVAVPTATVFTFETAQPCSPTLTNTTRMVTTNVGLPLGYLDIPLPYGYAIQQVIQDAIELESGAGGFELEDGSGVISLEGN